ncbi:MAG: response regulator [Dehalococcoidia bacterium]
MRKILIADDERSLRLLVHVTLRRDGVQILEAKDGTEALRIARAERPELILLDVQMPGMSGFEVCRMLKEEPETAPITVIMLTSQSQPSARQLGKQVGANEYLTKPFSPLQLIHMVEGLLQTS